jgi:putative ATPase
LVILASEDIGNADPMGLVVATAAAQAVQFVGMPEAQLNLSQATAYLATAPKSNASAVAIGRAQEDIRTRGAAPVPMHLRGTGYPGAAKLGHGAGYHYPHDAPDGDVDQEYIPASAQSQTYYEPARYTLVARPSGTVHRVVVRVGDDRHEIEVGKRVGRVVTTVEMDQGLAEAPPKDGGA